MIKNSYKKAPCIRIPLQVSKDIEYLREDYRYGRMTDYLTKDEWDEAVTNSHKLNNPEYYLDIEYHPDFYNGRSKHLILDDHFYTLHMHT